MECEIVTLRYELLATIKAKDKAEAQENIAMSNLGKMFVSFQKTCTAYQQIRVENSKLRGKLIECGQHEFLSELGTRNEGT